MLFVTPAASSPFRQIVFYGFFEHHEFRNVAPASWMRGLSRFPGRSHVFVPYATIDEYNTLIRHQPEAYPPFPFSDKLAIISLFDQALVKIKDRIEGREDQRVQVTEKLLLQISTLTDTYNARFVPVVIEASIKTREHYKRFFKRNNIMAIDCVEPLSNQMRVKGEGHPNGKLNSKWASCITDFVHTHNLIN